MHFNTEVAKTNLDPLDKFMKEMGIKDYITQPKLVINKSGLPIETSVSVLEART
jgi:hypothetical protein